MRDRAESQHYTVARSEAIQVPAGNFTAIRVERSDGKATNWYVPSLGLLPVKVQQVSGDGSTAVLELKQK